MRDRPKEKILDMTRSVLPSRARKMARITRQKIHRASRRQTRMTMEWMEDLQPEDFESSDGYFWESEDNLADEKDNRLQIHELVRDRRGADNLGGFLRWAKQNTQHLESEVEKYFAIKSKLGSSVIKDHALGHFVSLKRAENPFYFSSILDYPEKRELFRPTPWKTYQQLLDWIIEVINLDHRGLNQFLKKNNYLIRTCPESSKEQFRCWIDLPINEKIHDDSRCQSKDLLTCLELKRKQPELVFNCWIFKLTRQHSESRCLNQKKHVDGVQDAKYVADFFWNEYHYRGEVIGLEESLIKFLKSRNIIDD